MSSLFKIPQVKVEETFTGFLWEWLRGRRLFSKKRERSRLVVRLIVIINIPSAPPFRILYASLLRKWVRKFGDVRSRFQAFVEVPRYLGGSGHPS